MASGRRLRWSPSRENCSASSGLPCEHRPPPRRPPDGEGLRGMLMCDGGGRTRPESPRRYYATPDLGIGATRAPRRRQLPTNHGHAALPSGVIRAYQSDSSSRRRRLSTVALQTTLPSWARPPTPLDSRSFHISSTAIRYV